MRISQMGVAPTPITAARHNLTPSPLSSQEMGSEASRVTEPLLLTGLAPPLLTGEGWGVRFLLRCTRGYIAGPLSGFRSALTIAESG